MDATAALIAGLGAGLAIAMQVGAVSLLVVETTVVAGSRVGVAAGMGVATVDVVFAGVAAGGGGAASAVLAAHEPEIRVAAAACLIAIAVHGLVTLREPGRMWVGSARAAYTRFLAITAANPLTIASFAAIAASLSLAGPAAAVAFAVGAGTASAAWHLALPLAAGRATRWVTPARRRALAVVGRVAVLAIAVHLASSA
jgi:threonine/homoserine/homoserine lactone efflux protein